MQIAPFAVQFTDESLNSPTSWIWDFGDGNSSNLQNPKHTYSIPGTYTVELVASNMAGSESMTKTDFVTVSSPTPIKEVLTNNVLISPNPTNSFVNISANKNYEVRLLDITGKLLLQKTMTNNSTTIDISAFPKGILILHLFENGETVVKRIVKE